MSKRLKVLNLLGLKCAICGYCDNIRCIDFDHIHEDGGLERKHFESHTIYQLIIDIYEMDEPMLIAYINSRYQLLCVLCHREKTTRKRSRSIQDIMEKSNADWKRLYELKKIYTLVQEHKYREPYGVYI